MKTIVVEIIGTSPLLQHRWTEEAEAEAATRRVNIKRENPRIVAERNAYVGADGSHYFSAFAISRLLRDAGGAHKQRGSRKSLRYVVPAAVRLTADTITLQNADGGKLNGVIKACEVDSRPVTIPATKGHVMRHRPRYNSWGAAFSLVANDELLPIDVVQQLLVEGGVSIGIGDFRPERGGPFGTFRVVRFEERA